MSEEDQPAKVDSIVEFSGEDRRATISKIETIAGEIYDLNQQLERLGDIKAKIKERIADARALAERWERTGEAMLRTFGIPVRAKPRIQDEPTPGLLTNMEGQEWHEDQGDLPDVESAEPTRAATAKPPASIALPKAARRVGARANLR